MPKIDNIEETPNPNAVKFVLKEPVTTGAARSFRNAGEAQDELDGVRVRRLFDVVDLRHFQ